MNWMFDVTGLTTHTAEGIVAFCKKEIDDIRAATAGTQPPPVCSQSAASLATFTPCTQDEVRRIVMASPTKSCWLDPVPTFLVREFVDLLLPYITDMVNASLTQGLLPMSQCHAIVTPRLKNLGLDATDMSNYRHVFSSKLVERVVAARLHDYLSTSGLIPPCQSAYRQYHSTETDVTCLVCVAPSSDTARPP